MQAIAGISPSTETETTIMIVWPSVARYWLGRWFGGWYENKAGFFVVTVGNILALILIPVSIVLYFLKVLPWIATRYRLTNRRLIVERGIMPVADRFVDLDRFDAIDIVVRPGQRWYKAGDLVFRKGNVETFRIDGVSRPEAFKNVVWKAHQSYVAVRRELQKQGALV
jgi:hypothetical protein